MLTSIAYAMGQTGGGAGQGGAGFSLVPLILMFAIFYFLLIRPQQKKNKEHRRMVAELKKGDRIITTGGIHGRVTGVDENTLTVEIADRVRIKLGRGNVAGLLQSGAADKGRDKERPAGPKETPSESKSE